MAFPKLVGAQVDESMYNKLRSLAKTQDRSIASLIRIAINMYVRMNESG